ncbi:MAG: lysoplasmalogenase [Candidatus Hydrogenedentes bacterium]|nr:lysoplasmalogenase [Candidatus Hydrogenedentota bacterium]
MSRNSTLLWALALLTALSAAGVTLALNGQWIRLHFPSVLAASTCFVALPIAGGALSTAYGRFLVAGLVAFWVGDVLGGQHYLLGMVFFCMGHAGFICAFAARGIERKRILTALPPMILVVATILRWLLPHVNQPIDVFAVCTYSTVIGIMVLTAFGASGGTAGKLILTAALTIFVSDIFVARWRYVNPEVLNGYIVYPLYYAACLLLGFSALSGRQRRQDLRLTAKTDEPQPTC